MKGDRLRSNGAPFSVTLQNRKEKPINYCTYAVSNNSTQDILRNVITFVKSFEKREISKGSNSFLKIHRTSIYTQWSSLNPLKKQKFLKVVIKLAFSHIETIINSFVAITLEFSFKFFNEKRKSESEKSVKRLSEREKRRKIRSTTLNFVELASSSLDPF